MSWIHLEQVKLTYLNKHTFSWLKKKTKKTYYHFSWLKIEELQAKDKI